MEKKQIFHDEGLQQIFFIAISKLAPFVIFFKIGNKNQILQHYYHFKQQTRLTF